MIGRPRHFIFNFANRGHSLFKFKRMLHVNRLSSEKSPYLLQHQNNPVDWYPWGKEAFDKAKSDDKPIFLSIGYSTCHWCHVMERESFEKEDIAKIMNENFINIKVDREERPDVDAQYMLFVQATTGGGGWPMSVFLTPDLKPFFGGTYFPPKDAFSQPGFPSILNLVAQKWKTNSADIKKSGDRFIEQLQSALEQDQFVESQNYTKDYQKWITNAFEYYCKKFDSVHGGFGGQPKFPTPVNLQFLLNFALFCRSLKKSKNTPLVTDVFSNAEQFEKQAMDMARFTLEKIWLGGIHDHIGMGIHRYSVDRKWHVPHFEKMLYDQGQLLSVYSDAYLIDNQKPGFYLDAIKDIVSYSRNNLQDQKTGAFYCAEDADSLPDSDAKEKKEGAFAVWSAEEIRKNLSPREAEIFMYHFSVEEGGNVNAALDHHGELKGQNILMVRCPVVETANKFGLSEEECGRILKECKKCLAAVRANRPKPHLDDKILVSWNSYAIQGLCKAYSATGEIEYLHIAENALDFIKSTMMVDGNRLIRVYREGLSDIPGMVSDYVNLISALLDLWNCTLKTEYLNLAQFLQQTCDDKFWDSNGGGYFNSDPKMSDIVLPLKDIQDGAEPSANSVAASNLFRLSLICGDEKYRERYHDLVSYFSNQVASSPFAMPAFLVPIVQELMEIPVIGIILPKSFNLADPLSSDPELAQWKGSLKNPYFLFKAIPSDKDKVLLQACRGNVCQAPREDLIRFGEEIQM